MDRRAMILGTFATLIAPFPQAPISITDSMRDRMMQKLKDATAKLLEHQLCEVWDGETQRHVMEAIQTQVSFSSQRRLQAADFKFFDDHRVEFTLMETS